MLIVAVGLAYHLGILRTVAFQGRAEIAGDAVRTGYLLAQQAHLLLGLFEQLVAGVELARQAANPFLGGGAAFLYLRDRAFLVGNPLFQGGDDPFLLLDGIAAPLRRSGKGGEQEKEGQYAGGLHHGHSFSALPCSMRRVIWSAS